MACGVEAAIRSYERPRAYADRASVDKGGIEVELRSFANDDVEAVISLDWGADPRLFGQNLVIGFRRGLDRWKSPRVVGNTVYIGSGLCAEVAMCLVFLWLIMYTGGLTLSIIPPAFGESGR